MATRGQADMRGLGTAGRGVRQERTAGLGSSVTGTLWVSVAHSCVAGRSTRCYLPAPKARPVRGPLLVHDGAKDQHQPASSRAIATFAITGRFLCSR
jgi:hypothetical protein